MTRPQTDLPPLLFCASCAKHALRAATTSHPAVLAGPFLPQLLAGQDDQPVKVIDGSSFRRPQRSRLETIKKAVELSAWTMVLWTLCQYQDFNYSGVSTNLRPAADCLTESPKLTVHVVVELVGVIMLAACLLLPTAPSAARAFAVENVGANNELVTTVPARTVAVLTPSRSVTQVISRLNRLRLINYFPEAHSWAGMWTSFDPTILAADFARIRGLNGNAVRITVFPSVFGYPNPAPLMQDRLRQVVGIATRNGLTVQLSVFDQFTGWRDLTGSRTWARLILSPYVNDTRLAFVDLRNEIDPDDSDQVAWAKNLLPFAKTVLGTVPVTVSKSDSGTPAALCYLKRRLGSSTPDFWDWHYYGVEGMAYGFFNQARTCAAPQPLYIGEAGASSWSPGNRVSSLASGVSSYEAYQAYYFRVLADAATRLGLPPIAPWMLTDVDPAGAPPQPTPTEYHYGLYRGDGSPKPIANVVARYFAGAAVSQSFNNSFEAASASGLTGPLPLLWHASLPLQTGLRWDRSTAHTGVGSVSISSAGGAGSRVPAFWAVPVDPHVTPARMLTASVWAKGRSVKGRSTLSISFFDSTGVYAGQIESRPVVAGNSSWTLLTAAGRAPTNANYARIYLKSADNPGRVWFDDVRYTPTG